VLGVAARHIHSDSSIIHRDDFDNAVTLLVALMMKLDADQVADLTA
jgi:endoglucanase